MLQIVTGCTGENCPRHNDCELYYVNLSRKSPGITFPLESWATFGSTTTWVNQETGESGCEREWHCGPNGNYKMFKPYMKPLFELTLGEIKEICFNHLKDNKSKYCDDCKLYDFCNDQISNARCPADWKLNGEN